jgi:GNAT superfamily N-acetyltransferase
VNSPIATRWATSADLSEIRHLVALAIDALQAAFLTPAQIAASHAIMGVDTQLIEDGTYLLAQRDGVLISCGGWSRRATLYGGDHSGNLRDATLLDPAVAPAKIRAMYTHPDDARQGVGRIILAGCEDAAKAAGFAAVELMATASGYPLYAACGYQAETDADAEIEGVVIPLVKMRKALAADR